MSFSESLGFWPQFNVSDEQIEMNFEIDHENPSKRAKNSADNQQMSHNNHRSSPPLNPPAFNQPNGRIFFKTRHCVKFRMGQCKNGENCNFAHGDDDLRQPPPNWQELVSNRIDERGSSNGNANGNGNGNEGWEDDDDRIIHKMKLCKRYYNGEECPYGERCNFLHKDPPKFRDVAPPPPRFRDSPRESSAISIGTTGPPMVPPRAPDNFEVNRTAANLNVNGEASRGNSRPIYWKTRICMKFETTGYCPFGDTCHFAHGQAELLLPGGRPADSEQTVGNSTLLKQVPPLASDSTLVKNGNGFHVNEIGLSKKPLLKWNPTKKMNRIYGDWLDDLPLVLPNEVNC